MPNFIQLSPYSVLPFTASVTALFLGILVFLKNKYSETHRIFLVWSTIIFTWLFCYAINYSLTDANKALITIKIACASVILISGNSYHMIVSFLDLKKERKFVYLAHSINIILAILLYSTNYLISGTYKYFFGFYGKAGPFYIYTIFIFLIFTLRGIYLLYRTIRSNQLNAKKQIQAKYMLTGMIIAHLGSVDFLPKFNIEIYPFGAVFILLWVCIMTYAILKHQLLDINIVFRAGLIYSLLVTVITIVYLILVLSIEKIFHDLLGYHSFFTSVLAAVLIAIFFIPLKNKIQYLLDKYFFKGTHAQIAEQNELLRKELAQSEKMKAVATLASGMAHEIKNPITAIKTFTDFLPQKKNDPAFLDNFQKVVGTEVDRIDQLVRQLLDFAKPAPLKLQSTNIHQLIDDTLDLLNNQILRNKINVTKSYLRNPKNLSFPNASVGNPQQMHLGTGPDEAMTRPPTKTFGGDTLLNLDPNQFKQALLNIFMNAIDAMPEGGTLTICTSLDLIPKRLSFPNALVGNPDDPKIRPPTQTFGGDNSGIGSKSFVLIIQDTGHGISPKDLPHIFDPFFSKKSNGTGLGLSITQGIVQEHGGGIKVESVVGKGTRFVIELPICSDGDYLCLD